MVGSGWIFEARGLSLRTITEDEPILEEDMDRDQMVGIIRRRLNLEDQDWAIIEKNLSSSNSLKTRLRHPNIG